MGKITQVIIKSAEKVKSTHPLILKALDKAKNKKDEIPLVYEFIHVEGDRIYPNETNTIGKVSRIRIGAGGAYIGTVELFDENENVNQFDGVIDNIGVSVDPNTNYYDIDAFIIYNREKKAEVLKQKHLRKLSTQPNGFLLRQGQIPFMEADADKQKFIKDASKALIEEFNRNPMVIQQPDK